MCRSALPVMAILSLFVATSAIAEEFHIRRAAFASAIRDREPSPALDASSPVAPGPLWFWTDIQADKVTISELRSKKLLPLQHRWYKVLPGGAPGDDVEPDFIKPLEDIDETKIAGLSAEAQVRGFYTYRTASCRASISAGHWVAKVTDALGQSLPCADGRRCHFEIQVRTGGNNSADACPIGQ